MFSLSQLEKLSRALCLVSLINSISASPLASSSTCRCIPGDLCWPNTSQWNSLNEAINGHLIQTIPPGNVCHKPTYNATECAALQTVWPEPQTHYTIPASIMEPYFQNGSCTPFTAEAKNCELGYLAEYSINVSSSTDVIAGLAFAKKNNVRITIKNTGHDYLGRSAGHGSLSLWTHNLKDITFLNYTSVKYTGPAFKIGAGVQAFELYNATNTIGLRVVGGECPTVGLAGGYSQGGGHSALASAYGLGADQTLEWEVITADGKLVNASPTENSDLYWALSGGGPGNYGVVLSLTVRAHADGVVGGALITYAVGINVTEELYWAAYKSLHSALPDMVDQGATVLYIVSFNTTSVVVTYPGATKGDVSSLIQPFIYSLFALGIQYSHTITSLPTYFEHFTTYFGPLPGGQFEGGQPTGGRLLPRANVLKNTTLNTYTTAMRTIVSSGNASMFGLSINVNHTVAENAPSSNAVLPAWRTTISHLVIIGTTPYDAPVKEQRDAQDRMTKSYLPLLAAAFPNSGAYMNEADFQETNWKVDFYGDNYNALKTVKENRDPDSMLYVRTGVGSDKWTTDDQGRLCHA